MKLIIGAGGKFQEGWVATEQNQLDMLRPEDFIPYKPIEAILIEDCAEHLSIKDALKAFKNCYNALSSEGYLRIAVPDGYHPDKGYIEYVSPPNMGHLTLFNYHNLQDLLAQAGFRIQLLEWWDELHVFHTNPWSESDGYIERCLANDPRNKDGQPNYTSLILDAKKIKDLRPGLEKSFEFIRENDMRGVSEYNRRKATTFYELARSAPVGVIIELGCYHGFGTVPLWHGAQDSNKNRVIAVDCYVPMQGWIGEPYGPEDELIWHANMVKACAHPLLCKGDALVLAESWTEPVSLLVHDLGTKGRLVNDLLAWEKHFVIGGIIAIRDLDDYSMGTEAACDSLISTGRWGKRIDWPAFITSLERVKNV
jgi:predicted SAM-dependent methyltransferase